jgi:hypothetical protein
MILKKLKYNIYSNSILIIITKMSSLKQNDIVLITGASSDDPTDSAYINLFGKIKEKKLKNVEVFIDIQGKTAKYDSIYLKK